MGTRMLHVSGMDEIGDCYSIPIEIRDTRGVVVGRIGIYAEGAQDGSVRAQLELRFADKPSAFYTSSAGVDTPGYAVGWPGVMVEVEPRQSVSGPLRFSINIPGETGVAGTDVRPGEASFAKLARAREAIQA